MWPTTRGWITASVARLECSCGRILMQNAEVDQIE
jgi:hypothetical protein